MERGAFAPAEVQQQTAAIASIHMQMIQSGTRLGETIIGSSFHRVLRSRARDMLGNHIWPYTSNRLCEC